MKQVSGQGYVWPLGAKKQSYQVFDTTLQKPVTFKFAGTATTSGIPTYKYVAVVPPTQTGTEVLPGALVGEKAAHGHAARRCTARPRRTTSTP